MQPKQRPWLVKLMLTVAGRSKLNKVRKSTLNPEKTQRDLLANFIKRSENTAFGKDHKFSEIKNYNDFAKNVPIREYNDFIPYINRMTKGESDILFPGKPVLYNTSSGTTGKPKLIPISKEFSEELSAYNRLWLYSIMEQNPSIYNGKSLTSVGAAQEGTVEDGTPIGSISGNSFRTVPGPIKLTHSSIYQFFCIEDYNLRYYAIARNALANNITVSICPSIANIMRYHEMIMKHFDAMVEEIREGIIRDDIMATFSEEDRIEVEKTLFPNPERADELIRLKKQHGDQLMPKHYWPNLAVVNAWIQGNFAVLVKKIRPYFPETTAFRAFGYQASEGRFGMSLDNSWDYSLLNPVNYFYEFIPVENIEDKNPKVLMLHELEDGKRYYIIITNSSGLYRYDMNDILEVVGFYNKAPLLKFIQKGAGIVNIMGEKLSEEQIIEAVNITKEKTNIKVNNYLMFGDYKQFKYEFFAEFSDLNITDDDKKTFINKFDKVLQSLNIEYESKRKSERLSIPEFIELPIDSYQKIKESLVRKSLAKDGQFKDLYLSSKITTREVLKEVC